VEQAHEAFENAPDNGAEERPDPTTSSEVRNSDDTYHAHETADIGLLGERQPMSSPSRDVVTDRRLGARVDKGGGVP
jgi:hypothetical protein